MPGRRDEVVPAINLEDLVDIPEGARLAHCSEHTLRAALRDKKLKRFKFGSRTLVSKTDLTEYITRCTKAAA